MNINIYREAIRKKVCEHCIDQSEDGRCTLTGGERCGIEVHLLKIVKVVRSVNSSDLGDYVKALREQVCNHCKNQSPDGTCKVRNALDCGLDRYFPLIVEVIEEVDNTPRAGHGRL